MGRSGIFKTIDRLMSSSSGHTTSDRLSQTLIQQARVSKGEVGRDGLCSHDVCAAQLIGIRISS